MVNFHSDALPWHLELNHGRWSSAKLRWTPPSQRDSLGRSLKSYGGIEIFGHFHGDLICGDLNGDFHGDFNGDLIGWDLPSGSLLHSELENDPLVIYDDLPIRDGDFP